MFQPYQAAKLLTVFSFLTLSLLAISPVSAKEYGPYGPFKDAVYSLSKKNFAFFYRDNTGKSYVQVRDAKPMGPYSAAGLYQAVTALRVTDDGSYGFIYSKMESDKARLYANINGTSIAIRDRYLPREPKLEMVDKDKWMVATDQIAYLKFNANQVIEAPCSPAATEPCMINSIGISDNLWGYAYESFHNYKGYIKIFDRIRGNAQKIYGPYDFDGREGEAGNRRSNLAIGRRDWIASYYNAGRGYVMINGTVSGPFLSVNHIYAKDDIYLYCYTDLDSKNKCNIGGKVYEDFGTGQFQTIVDGNNWGVRSGGQCIVSINTVVMRTDCDRLSLSDGSYSIVRAGDLSKYVINGEEFAVSPTNSRLSLDGAGPVWAAGRNWAYIAFPPSVSNSDYCARVTINNLNYNVSNQTTVGDKSYLPGCQAGLSLTGTSYAMRINNSGQEVWIRAGLDFVNSTPVSSGKKATCGNQKREANEECDGVDFGGKTCASKGFYGGGVKCSSSCKLDYSSCVANSICTDNDGGANPFIQGASNLRISGAGNTAGSGSSIPYRDQCLSATKLKEYYCVPSSKYPGLTIASREYDCKCSGGVCTDNKPVCNRNGKINAGESCDGRDLAKQTCKTLGFDGGSLTCGNDCQFNTGGCLKCGDNKIDSSLKEKCDGKDLGLNSCESLGFMCGELRCSNTCQGFDTSMCKTSKADCTNLQLGGAVLQTPYTTVNANNK